MLFGGKLASILVCDVCKKVSVTYEDFNDLSLSIKPEDYVNKHHRKRDRIKRIARKLRIRPPSAYAAYSNSANNNGSGSGSGNGDGDENMNAMGGIVIEIGVGIQIGNALLY